MNTSRKNSLFLLGMFVLLPILLIVHLYTGPIELSFSDFWNSIVAFDENEMAHVVIRELRFPRMLTATLAGAGLSIAGLLMQTLFNNPLAGPYVLGINSGASLFVAFALMTGVPLFASDLGLAANALIGAFLFGTLILLFSTFVRQQISLLLIGLMLGSFTAAIVSILQSVSGMQELKLFTLWAMGSLQKITLEQLPILVVSFVVTMLGALLVVKPLNLLVLGTHEAALLGVRLKRVRLLIILITALITGVVTAFCGPIAFIGLAIPNLVRIVMKTQNHRLLIIASALCGAIFLVLCDIVVQAIESSFTIPINAFTSLIGAPFVILLVIRRLR